MQLFIYLSTSGLWTVKFIFNIAFLIPCFPKIHFSIKTLTKTYYDVYILFFLKDFHVYLSCQAIPVFPKFLILSFFPCSTFCTFSFSLHILNLPWDSSFILKMGPYNLTQFSFICLPIYLSLNSLISQVSYHLCFPSVLPKSLIPFSVSLLISTFNIFYRIQKELAEITLDPPPNCRYIYICLMFC